MEIRTILVGWNSGEIRLGWFRSKDPLGMNPYQSKYALFLEKSGEAAPKDLSDNEAVRLGNDLEQYVADRWMESTGKNATR